MKQFIHGNEAVVRAALDAGCNFFAGYPITPSSQIAHKMAELLPQRGGIFIQMEDEIAVINTIIGASMAGARAMTATSGPGLSLMQESIGYSAITETPLVIVDVMRAGPATGIPTFPSQGDVFSACYGSHGDYPVVVLAPVNILEVYSLTFKAFYIAEKYRVPVIVLIDGITAQMKESVSLPNMNVSESDKPKRPHLGEGIRHHTTGLIHGEDGMPIYDPQLYKQVMQKLMNKIQTEELMMIQREGKESAQIFFITYGICYRSAKEAVCELEKQGISVGLIKLSTLSPFPDKKLKEFVKGAKKVIVPEMNMGQVVKEVERCLCNECEIVSVNSLGTLMEPEVLIEEAIK